MYANLPCKERVESMGQHACCVRCEGKRKAQSCWHGEGSRQERYAAPQGVLPQCGMQHGAQETAAEGSRSAAQTQLPMGCRERGHRLEASRPDFGVH